MIRAASLDDIPALLGFWNPVIRDTTITFSSEEKTPEGLAVLLAERPVFLVADDGQGAVGLASYAQFRGGNGYRHAAEHTIILAPDTRGQGLGRALMDALESHARAGGVHVMVAGISAENAPACAFHAALGYVETGRMPQVGRKFDRWLDLVLMQKTL